MATVLDAEKDLERATPENAYVGLLELIRGGHLVPGDRVKGAEMARRLGMGYAVVREAILALGRDGILDFKRHKGAMVRTYSRKEVEQLFEMRIAVEGMTARYVAASAERDIVLAHLHEQVVLLGDACRRHDLALVEKYDDRFHEILWEAGATPVIRETLRVLLVSIRVAVDVGFYQVQSVDKKKRERMIDLQLTVGSHERLIEAMKSGNNEMIGKAIREHVRLARETVMEYYALLED